jgi:hypothetical protein
MIEVHHAAFALRLGRGPDEEILGDLNFRWSELFGDTIALRFGQNIAALYDNYLARLDRLLRKQTATMDRALSFFDLRRKVGQIQLAIPSDCEW